MYFTYVRKAQQSFAARRNVAKLGRPELDLEAKYREKFPRYEAKFKPLGKLAVTLLEEGEINSRRANDFMLNDLSLVQLANGVFWPKPKSTKSPLRFDVLRVDYFGNSDYYKDLVIMLDDKDDVLHRERQTYTERVDTLMDRARGWKSFVPHITIARLDVTQCIEDIRLWMEQHTPDNVGLQPVTSDPKRFLDRMG